MEVKDKIIKLRQDLERYNYFYYVKNESLIGDTEYDKLLKGLEELEEKYPEYKEGKYNTKQEDKTKKIQMVHWSKDKGRREGETKIIHNK